jgi:hypothetical protein
MIYTICLACSLHFVYINRYITSLQLEINIVAGVNRDKRFFAVHQNRHKWVCTNYYNGFRSFSIVEFLELSKTSLLYVRNYTRVFQRLSCISVQLSGEELFQSFSPT